MFLKQDMKPPNLKTRQSLTSWCGSFVWNSFLWLSVMVWSPNLKLRCHCIVIKGKTLYSHIASLMVILKWTGVLIRKEKYTLSLHMRETGKRGRYFLVAVTSWWLKDLSDCNSHFRQSGCVTHKIKSSVYIMFPHKQSWLHKQKGLAIGKARVKV